MAEQRTLAETYDPRFDEARLRDREADFTPRPIVEQIVGWIARQPWFAARPPIRVLDPAAGAGVYAAVMRDQWPAAEVHAVEPADEEHEHLRALMRGRGHVHPCTLEAFHAAWSRSRTGAFNLIVTNPAFSLARAHVELCREMLDRDGLLVLLLPSRFGQKSEEEIEWFMRHETDARGDHYLNVPVEEVQVSGTIAFRGGAGAAWDVYSHFAWGPRPRLFPHGEEPQWNCSRLPMLPGSARRWIHRPGSETET